MALFRKPSILQNKMKRLEREISLIESDINSLSKTLADPDFSGDLPRLRSQPPAEEVSSSAADYMVDTSGSMLDAGIVGRQQAPFKPVAAKTEPVMRGGIERRTAIVVDSRQDQVQQRMGRAVPGREVPSQERPGGARMPVRDERFAGYLSSSMQALSPNRQQKRIQRNKAIVMVLFLALLILLFMYHYLNT